MSGNHESAVARFSQQLGEAHEQVDLEKKLEKILGIEEELKLYIAKHGSDDQLLAFKKELTKAKTTYSLERMDQFDKVAIVEIEDY